jgi:hypothetical protein
LLNKSFAAAALGVAKFIANTVFEFGHTVALLTSDSDVHKTAISGRFKTSKSDLRSTTKCDTIAMIVVNLLTPKAAA